MFTLNIKTGNDAMRTTHAIAEAIRRVADVVGAGYAAHGLLRDANGNTVGSWLFAPDESTPEDHDHDTSNGCCDICGRWAE